MPLRYRKSKSILPGVRLTAGKRSASVRLGSRQGGISRSTTGRTTGSLRILPGLSWIWSRKRR